jgi:hypothetical protein
MSLHAELLQGKFLQVCNTLEKTYASNKKVYKVEISLTYQFLLPKLVHSLLPAAV